MRRLVVLGATFALVFVMSGCTARTPVVTPTSTETPPSPSPSPSAPRVPVAVSAVYAAEDAIWLYDARADSVTEFARGQGIADPMFISRTEVSFLQHSEDGGTAVRVLDLQSRQVRELFSVSTGIRAYGWSPDRETLGYVTTLGEYPSVQFRSLVGEGATLTVATLARALGRGGSIFDQSSLRFSKDGRLVLIVYTPADGDPGRAVPDEQSQLQVRTVDGDVAFAVDHDREPTMGIWLPDGSRMLYRSDDTVRSWTPGARGSQRLASIGWFNPWPSPNGGFIAYDTGATSTGVRVRMLDLSSGKPAEVGGEGFFHPVVANVRTVWAQRIQRCEPDCLEPVVAGPEVVAFDVIRKTERTLQLPTLLGVDVLYL